jgi:hypothetical protein
MVEMDPVSETLRMSDAHQTMDISNTIFVESTIAIREHAEGKSKAIPITGHEGP